MKNSQLKNVQRQTEIFSKMINRNPKKKISKEYLFRNVENIDDNDENNLPLIPNHVLNPKLILSNSKVINDNKISLILDKGKELLISFDSKQDVAHITKKLCRQYHLSSEMEQALFKNLKKRAEIEFELSNPLLEVENEKPIKFPKREYYDKTYNKRSIVPKAKSEERLSNMNKFFNNSPLKINLKTIKKFQSPKINVSNNNKKEVFKRLYIDYQNREKFLKALSNKIEQEEAIRNKTMSRRLHKRKIVKEDHNLIKNTINNFNNFNNNNLESSIEKRNKSDDKIDEKSNSIIFDCFNVQIKNFNNSSKRNRNSSKSLNKIQKINNIINKTPFYLLHPLYSNSNFGKLTFFSKLGSSRSLIGRKKSLKQKQKENFLNTISNISLGSPTICPKENEESFNKPNFEIMKINNDCNKLSYLKFPKTKFEIHEKTKFKSFCKIFDIINSKNKSKISYNNINLKEISPELLIAFPKLFTELRNQNKEYDLESFLQFTNQLFKELPFGEQESVLNIINNIEKSNSKSQPFLNIKEIKFENKDNSSNNIYNFEKLSST